MELSIPQGEKMVSFSRPDHWQLLTVAESIKVDGITDIASTVKETLQNPIGCEPLDKQINPENKVVIVVDDISRPTPSAILLEPLVDFLMEKNLPPRNIRIIFGLGIHREMSEEEVKEKLGSRIAGLIQWENHDCYSNLINLGKSRAGTPVLVNKSFVEADYTIAVGLIEPHLWAGYSGGYKAVMPGVSGVETIVKNHHLLMKGSKKGVRVGEVDENPFRKDIEDIGQMIGLNFIVNCILNSEKKICCIIAGDPAEAWKKGVKQARNILEITVDQQADVIVAESEPLNIDFRQSSKAAFNSIAALRKGGVMIVISSCPEGIGNLKLSDKPPNRNVTRLLAKILPAKLLMKVLQKQGYGLEDSAGTFQMMKFISAYNYIFVTESFSERERKLLSVADHAKTLENAFEIADKILKNEKKEKPVKVSVFPLAGCFYARLTR